MKALILISVLLNSFSGLGRACCCDGVSIKTAKEITKKASHSCCEEKKSSTVAKGITKKEYSLSSSQKESRCMWECCGVFESQTVFFLSAPKRVEVLDVHNPLQPKSVLIRSKKEPPRLS